MAYTKAPTEQSHNVTRVQAAGSQIIVSDIADRVPATLNYVDCYPETEKQWGKDPVRRIHKRGGWNKVVCTGSISGAAGAAGSKTAVMAYDYDNYPVIFLAKRDTIYAVNYSTNVVTTVTTFTDLFGGSLCDGTNALDATNTRKICFLDYQGQLKTFSEDSSGVTSTNLGFGVLGVSGVYGLCFIDGYLFASDGFKIFNSSAGNLLTTWTSTNFLAAEQFSDGVAHMAVHKNYLVVWGTDSIEFFYDGGIEVGSPLARQESYSTRVGMVRPRSSEGGGGSYTGAQYCRILDDLYFVGKSNKNAPALYRIKDFKVEEIESSYMRAVLGWVGSSPTSDSNKYAGVESIIQDGNPAIVVYNNVGNYCVYLPEEDAWYQMELGNDFPYFERRLGNCLYAESRKQPYMFGWVDTATDDVLWKYYPDNADEISVTGTVYSEVIDIGNNRTKHIARVDVLGDFSTNSLTLSYNPTPNYAQTYTACTPVQSAATIGYGNNISWYNLGGFRRFSLKMEMTGTRPAMFDGYEIEYTVGVS